MRHPRRIGTEITQDFRQSVGNNLERSVQRVVAKMSVAVRAVTESYARATRNCLVALLTISMLLCWLGAVAAEAQDQVDVSGRWKGTRATNGQPGFAGSKVQSISFDLSQNGQAIVGSYRCYGGRNADADCPNPVGKIMSGTVTGDSVKIDVQSLPNSIACSYSGNVHGTIISGTYICHSAGSLSSIGNWKVRRH